MKYSTTISPFSSYLKIPQQFPSFSDIRKFPKVSPPAYIPRYPELQKFARSWKKSPAMAAMKQGSTELASLRSWTNNRSKPKILTRELPTERRAPYQYKKVGVSKVGVSLLEHHHCIRF